MLKQRLPVSTFNIPVAEIRHGYRSACISMWYDIRMLLKPIPDHPGYFASDEGDIYSILRSKTGSPKKRKVTIDYHGRAIINLQAPPGSKFTTKTYSVSILILTAFKGPRPKGDYQCSHLNGNALDNRPVNLEWETRAQNEARKEEHGTIMRGELNGRAKLTEQDIRDIRQALANGATQMDMARKYLTTQSNIWDIKERNSWKHVK